MTLSRAFFGILLTILLGAVLYFGTDLLIGGFERIFRLRTAGPERATSTPLNTSSSSPINSVLSPNAPGSGFRGPTGDPYIVGPKSNPPDY